MELPTRTVLLCDGGFIPFAEETYRGRDAVFGSIASIETVSEGVGQQLPPLEMVMLPAGDASPGDLARPEYQESRVRFWIGEYDRASGTLSGEPDLLYDGQVDQMEYEFGSSRTLAVSVVSRAVVLFEGNIGNSLNSAWHKSVWPGELGHDNATGLSVPVAWGAVRPK